MFPQPPGVNIPRLSARKVRDADGKDKDAAVPALQTDSDGFRLRSAPGKEKDGSEEAPPSSSCSLELLFPTGSWPGAGALPPFQEQ